MFDGPIYGAEPPRGLPKYDPQAVLLHAERFNRAATAQQDWAEEAKRCVEYFEGRQWSDADLAAMREQKRAALTFNKIKPLVNLVNGYMLSNPTEARFFPGDARGSSARTAEALTHVTKNIAQNSDLPYVDGCVWLDGITGGRGYYDARLDFSSNDFGEVRWRDQDPFSTYPDPECDSYDLNDGSFVFTARNVSIEELEATYGRRAANLVRPLFSGGGIIQQSVMGDAEHEIAPWRTFGGEEDGYRNYGTFYEEVTGSWVDNSRKTIRLLDVQHNVWVRRWMFVDLETGDRKLIPQSWDKAKIEKVKSFAAARGNPVAVVNRQVKLVRWTHMAGDIIVYDEWSPYDSFTIVPFFPYFRRGKTRGMVADLLDPQDEINKRRSARLNIVSRTANGGWIVEKGALDADGMDELKRYGAKPGVVVEWTSKGGKLSKPDQIQPGASPVAHAQLEQEAEDDLKKISGVNDSALGQLDRVQSGRAIEARQRQTVVGLEGFVANWRHTKRMCGLKDLNLIQNHYTEERVVRVIGEGDTPEQMIVNQRTAEGVINNLSIGRYVVKVDEQPLSKSFLEGQFEELLRLKELQVPIPDNALIDASSVGRKDEIKAALAEIRRMEMAGMGGLPPSGGGVARDGGNLPANEPGRPPGPAAA